MTWRYTTSDGQRGGPIEQSELQGMLRSGLLPPSTMVWTDGMPGWESAANIPSLAARYGVGDVQAPAPAPESPTWYYADRGRQVGPVTWSDISGLARSGIVTGETPVWGGQGDWRPASQSDLSQVFAASRPAGPPPLSGEYVNNTFAWLCVAVPFVPNLIELADPSADKLSMYASLGLYVLVSALDAKSLKGAGHAAPATGWTFFIPVYLWKRASILKQSRANFAAWCVTLLLSIGISAGLTAPETKVNVVCNPTNDSFSCTVTHDQGRVTVNVCWDVVLTCSGGVRAIGHGCQVSAPDSIVTHVIPESEVQNLAQCTSATSTTLEHLVFTEQ